MEGAEGQGPTAEPHPRQADHLPEGSAKGHLLQEARLTSIPPAKPPSCPTLPAWLWSSSALSLQWRAVPLPGPRPKVTDSD